MACPSPVASCDPRPGSLHGVHVTLEPDSAGDQVAAPVTAQAGEIAVKSAATNPRSVEEGSASGVSPTDAASDALDRFVQELWDGRKVPHAYRAALAAIREGTEAGLVFVSSEQGVQLLEIV